MRYMLLVMTTAPPINAYNAIYRQGNTDTGGLRGLITVIIESMAKCSHHILRLGYEAHYIRCVM